MRPNDDIQRVLRILLDSKRVGGIIGRGGLFINHIRRTSGATLLIANPIPNSLFRVCTVEGTYHQTTEALKMIVDKMAEESCRTPPYQITLLVEEKNIGCVIGKKGSAISDIRALTNANIYISSHVLRHSTEKTVDISGQQRDCHRAVHLLLEQLYKNPAHAVTRILYDPRVDCPSTRNQFLGLKTPPSTPPCR